MTLYLAESSLKINILLKITQQDTKYLLNPLLNRYKIGDQPIMNGKIDKEENLDINYRARNIIKLTKDQIKRPFKLDPIPQIVVFHAQAYPSKGQGAKFTIPTFTTQSPMRPKRIHQLDRPVGYYRAQKDKGKRKRTYPQQVEIEEEMSQAPLQKGEENVQGPENVEDIQAQYDPQVLLAKQGEGEAKIEIQEVTSKEVQESSFTPKKINIKTLEKRRQKVIRKVIHFPLDIEPIPEEKRRG